MKNTTKYLAVICTGILAIAGCQKPEMESNPLASGDTTIITATLSEERVDSKTQMIPGNDAKSYKVIWENDDAVKINGNTSTGILINATNASSASFMIEGEVNAPYYAVYPASAATGFEEGAYTISLPATQTYVGSDKFAPESALMLGYSATAGNVAFKHAMAYIRLTLTAGSAPVKSVTFESNNQEALSGTFTATCTEGAWAMAKGTGSIFSVTLDCGSEGANIGDKMIIAIPSGTYAEGFRIVVKNNENQYMIKKSNRSFTAEMGGIYDMEFDFESQGTIVDGDIYTVSDWNAFAAAIEGGETYEGRTITLRSDLTVDTYFGYGNGTFEGTFDGNGKTMTANGNIWPLFATVGVKGVVKNLTMAGSFARFANTGECGNATIAKINKGLIQKVTNTSTAEIVVDGGVVFGSICGQNGGTLEECKNEGRISVTHNGASGTAFYGGGLCAIGHTVSGSPSQTALNTNNACSPGKFINCENHADIIATTKNGKPIRSGFGGICGVVYFNGVQFIGCKNYGDISRISNGEASNNGSASTGGILGRSAGWYISGNGDSTALDNGGSNGFDTQYTNCLNEGTILSKCRHSGYVTAATSGARNDNAGGIVGAAIGKGANIQKLSGCTNTGTITGGWNTTNTTVLGGLVGTATVTEIDDCDAICTIKSIDNDYSMGAAGGLVGFAIDKVSIKGGSIAKADISGYMKSCSSKDASAKAAFYGLVFGNIVTAATIESATAAGTISIDGTSLDVSAGTVNTYAVSTSSNKQPTITSLTWYTGSAN